MTAKLSDLRDLVSILVRDLDIADVEVDTDVTGDEILLTTAAGDGFRSVRIPANQLRDTQTSVVRFVNVVKSYGKELKDGQSSETPRHS